MASAGTLFLASSAISAVSTVSSVQAQRAAMARENYRIETERRMARLRALEEENARKEMLQNALANNLAYQSIAGFSDDSRSFLNINKELKLTTCWTNLSTEDNVYAFHSHSTKLSYVFYLQSKQDCYGLRLKKPEIIFPSIENSIIIFDGSVPHSIEYMPNKVFDSVDSYRYSVVFDFI